MMVGLSKISFIALLLICLGSQVRPDSPDHRYRFGDTVPIYAYKVGPYHNRWERYYDFPFCSPDTVIEKKDNLGKILTGERLVSTPYTVGFLVDKEFELSCNKILTKADVSLFRSMIKDDYRMQLYYDDLPIWGYVGWVLRDYDDENKSKYYLYKHFDFEIFNNKDRVIEVYLRANLGDVVDVTEDKEIEVNFTYSVTWAETERSFDKSVHGYVIANSSFTILILVICLLIFYIRVLSKDISKYACDVEEPEVTDTQDETAWKNIHGDVFRFPEHKSLFAAALGSGSQLLVLMVTILIMGVMGVFQPYTQEVYLKALVTVYAVTFIVSGYTSVSFYCQLEGRKWMENLLLTAGLYLGPLFLTFSFTITYAVFNGDPDAFPLSSVVKLSLVWMFLAFPLLLLGGVIGKNSAFDFQAPCRTAKCPREVPRLHWYKHIIPQMILAGFFQFSVINIPLFDHLYTVWGHGFHIFYNSMAIMFILLLIMTALVSVWLTYFQLAVENHEWWWRSFLCGGSTGLYVYGYGIYYYYCISDMYTLVQTFSFFGYMACLSYGIFLALGFVGFRASLFFVRYLYVSIKCD
ncbi:nonaspanin (TM9SF) [Artemisia annua]|uniref:Transmembrane 9 superfamily member n=1 Tax=Artemisia annua TaxID=35608 RepID=A0A2U1KX43_ARTAN|nr:nonaspanin (TM9SF) [Artemisia annua]